VPEPPSLGTLLTEGRSQLDIRYIVDRWCLGGILAREHGNLRRASRRLGLARNVLRERRSRLLP
jgi:hypothetical protein